MPDLERLVYCHACGSHVVRVRDGKWLTGELCVLLGCGHAVHIKGERAQSPIVMGHETRACDCPRTR